MRIIKRRREGEEHTTHLFMWQYTEGEERTVNNKKTYIIRFFLNYKKGRQLTFTRCRQFAGTNYQKLYFRNI